MGSLLQCFKVRIRAQIFGPDLGSMRPPPLLHLVAHLLIGTSLLTSYVSVLIHKNILNSSLPWRAQKQIHNTNSYAFQPATVFPNISSYLCLFTVFLLVLMKLRHFFLLCLINYEDVATTQIASIFFFLKCHFVTSQTLRFMLFTSTWFRVPLEFLFLNWYLGALFYTKIKGKKKI